MTTKKSPKTVSHKIAAANDKDLPFKPQVQAPDLSEPDDAPAAVENHTPLAQVDKLYAAPAPSKISKSNVVADVSANLQAFKLTDLEPFAKEKAYSTDASSDVHLFFVGRDDVHDILKYILSRVSISLYLNMFGFDDEELNNIIMQQALDASITMLITLDQSQAGGVHEKALLAADEKYNLAAYNTHFVIGQSATHQITHTKGFVADGKVACEGSTNWSASGEGTFVVTGNPGGAGYKAQNNTQSVITDRDTIIRFQTELITEHMTAASAAKGKLAQKPAPAQNIPVTAAPSNTKTRKPTAHKVH
jgi:hypothetical protein